MLFRSKPFLLWLILQKGQTHMSMYKKRTGNMVRNVKGMSLLLVPEVIYSYKAHEEIGEVTDVL